MADTGVHDAQRLKELQALPLDRKIQITQTRIIEWYQRYKGQVYVSFSGGKDSTILLHIARQIYPDIPAAFSNTGLEFAEIQRFVRTWDNVDIITPKMRFDRVVTEYGYPLISKTVAEAIYSSRRPPRARSKSSNVERETERDPETAYIWSQYTYYGRKRVNGEYEPQGRKAGVDDGSLRPSPYNAAKWKPLVYTPFRISHWCCAKMKKQPFHAYEKETGRKVMTAVLAEESYIRRTSWIKTGCNAFDGKRPHSNPMAFWTEQDVLRYIVDYQLPIADVYGDIVTEDKDGNQYPATSLLTEQQCRLKCTGRDRTGCTFCCFGIHADHGRRLRLFASYEPRKYEYAMGGGQWVDNPDYDPAMPEKDGDWVNWNPKKIWIPSKQGLGLRFVLDTINDIYGKDFIRYE